MYMYVIHNLNHLLPENLIWVADNFLWGRGADFRLDASFSITELTFLHKFC